MTKHEALTDAQHYADKFNHNVYVLRRGDVYKSTTLLTPGWKVAETVTPP